MTCISCGGTGQISYNDHENCNSCNGRGTVMPHAQYGNNDTGHWLTPGEMRCRTCGGSGLTRVTKYLSCGCNGIAVPPADPHPGFSGSRFRQPSKFNEIVATILLFAVPVLTYFFMKDVSWLSIVGVTLGSTAIALFFADAIVGLLIIGGLIALAVRLLT